jgi:hypothetical protein
VSVSRYCVFDFSFIPPPEPEPVVIEFGMHLSAEPVFAFSQAAMVWNLQSAVPLPLLRQNFPCCDVCAPAGTESAMAVTMADRAIAYRIMISHVIGAPQT